MATEIGGIMHRIMAMGTIIDPHFFTNAGCLMYTLPEVIWVGQDRQGIRVDLGVPDCSPVIFPLRLTQKIMSADFAQEVTTSF